jgi:hypothetical protein
MSLHRNDVDDDNDDNKLQVLLAFCSGNYIT